MVSDEELRRRVKAARAYAGFKSTAELAKAIGPHGKLGDRTLRTLEGDRSPRRFSDQHLVLIARAAGLPLEFFEVDFARLPELVDAPTLRTEPALEQRVAELEELVTELAGPEARREARRRALERIERDDQRPREAPPATPPRQEEG